MLNTNKARTNIEVREKFHFFTRDTSGGLIGSLQTEDTWGMLRIAGTTMEVRHGGWIIEIEIEV